jgi:hypothetical protein
VPPGTERLRVEVPFEEGLIVTVGTERLGLKSDGVAVKSTGPLNPCRLFTVIVDEPVPLGGIVRSEGFATSSKLGRVILIVM